MPLVSVAVYLFPSAFFASISFWFDTLYVPRWLFHFSCSLTPAIDICSRLLTRLLHYSKGVGEWLKTRNLTMRLVRQTGETPVNPLCVRSAVQTAREDAKRGCPASWVESSFIPAISVSSQPEAPIRAMSGFPITRFGSTATTTVLTDWPKVYPPQKTIVSFRMSAWRQSSGKR